MNRLALEFPDELLEAIAERVLERVAEHGPAAAA